MSDTGPVTEALRSIAYQLAQIQPYIPTYAHLLLSALFPIFTGAHASLSRPSSAAKPEKNKKKSGSDLDDDEDEDETENTQQMEGLSPSDAIIFPILAGCTLAGLYFIIKWLQDPDILNKMLNWYFAVFGVFSISRLLRDAIQVVHSLVFPSRYVNDGVEYRVKSRLRRAIPMQADANETAPRTSPLPGILATIPLPRGINTTLWSLRDFPKRKLRVKLDIRKFLRAKIQVAPQDILSFAIAQVAVIYFNTVEKPWWLTNLMGFGFSYTTLQLMSPTTFGTGALILSALFLYDIYFVFFTPMMVTVAKSLDVPIKLLIPRPIEIDEDIGEEKAQKHAMLGLGDIVLPGIMIGLALRFDLFLFYLRKQSVVASEKDKDNLETPTEMKSEEYISVLGRWGEHYWTRSQPTVFFPYRRSRKDVINNDATRFPKVYFIASMIGYVIGMVATLFAMHVSDHAQPALLYLVPGVLFSLFFTAVFRSEVGLMWNYSEAVIDSEEDKKDESETDPLKNKSIFSMARQKRQMEKIENSISDSIEIVELSDDSDKKNEEVSSAERNDDENTEKEQQKPSFFSVDENQHVIFLSVTTSPSLYVAKEKESKRKDELTEKDDSDIEHDSLSSDEAPILEDRTNKDLSSSKKGATEPAEKRRRVI